MPPDSSTLIPMSEKLSLHLRSKGYEIESLRNAFGLTQGVLAEAVGTSQRCISDAESERRQISKITLMRISLRFGVPLKQIAHIQLDESELPPRILEASLDVLKQIISYSSKSATGIVCRKKIEALAQQDYRFDRYSRLESNDQDHVWQIIAQKGWLQETTDSQLFRLPKTGDIAGTHINNLGIFLHLERMIGCQLQHMFFRLDGMRRKTHQKRLAQLQHSLLSMKQCVQLEMPLEVFAHGLLAFDLEIAASSKCMSSCVTHLNRGVTATIRTCHWVSELADNSNKRRVDLEIQSFLVASREEIVFVLVQALDSFSDDFTYHIWDYERATLTHAAIKSAMRSFFDSKRTEDMNVLKTANYVSDRFLQAVRESQKNRSAKKSDD